jgi:hypothetical protein
VVCATSGVGTQPPHPDADATPERARRSRRPGSDPRHGPDGCRTLGRSGKPLRFAWSFNQSAAHRAASWNSGSQGHRIHCAEVASLANPAPQSLFGEMDLEVQEASGLALDDDKVVVDDLESWEVLAIESSRRAVAPWRRALETDCRRHPRQSRLLTARAVRRRRAVGACRGSGRQRGCPPCRGRRRRGRLDRSRHRARAVSAEKAPNLRR